MRGVHWFMDSPHKGSAISWYHHVLLINLADEIEGGYADTQLLIKVSNGCTMIRIHIIKVNNGCTVIRIHLIKVSNGCTVIRIHLIKVSNGCRISWFSHWIVMKACDFTFPFTPCPDFKQIANISIIFFHELEISLNTSRRPILDWAHLTEKKTFQV